MIRRTLLPLATLVLYAASVHAQSADHGLSLLLFDQPRPGTLRAFIRFTDPALAASATANPNPAEFSAVLQGGAHVTSVQTLPKLGLGTVTIAAIDRSASFKAGTDAAFAVIEHLAKEVSPTERLGLMLFGTDITSYPTRTSASDALSDLAAAKATRFETRTRLLSSLSEAIARAAQEGASGFREVLVFTDAGEESAALDWEKVADEARAKGVRVSVFVLAPPNPSVALVTRLDWLRGMKARTGGIEASLADPAAAIAAVTQARAERNGWLAVDMKLCGMQRGVFDGPIRVQFRDGQAFSADTHLRQLLGPEVEQPCPSDKKVCGEPCGSWQSCDPASGQCVALACTSDVDCGGSAHCASGKCVAGARQSLAWLWVVLGTGLALLAIGLLVARRRRPEPPPAAAPAPVAIEPVPVAAPATPPVDAGVTLDPLPETHLVAIAGLNPPGQRWRLHRRAMRAGASPEADLVFAVPQISGLHAEFQLFPSGALWVVDLDSRNGTYVNNRRLAARERVELRAGDQVKLSSALILEVQRPGEPEPEKRAKEPEKSAKEPELKAPPTRRPTIIDRGNR